MDDFSFDKLPSTSQSTPKPRLEPPQVDPGEGLGTDSSMSETSSLMSMDETPDQQIRSRIKDIGRKVEDLVGKPYDSPMTYQKMSKKEVCEILQQMKDHMYSTYEGNSHAMGATLAELLKVLESLTKLSAVLQQGLDLATRKAEVLEALSVLNKALPEVQESYTKLRAELQQGLDSATRKATLAGLSKVLEALSGLIKTLSEVLESYTKLSAKLQQVLDSAT